MKSSTTARFRDAFAQLPPPIQTQARRAYQRFKQNPQHPSLRFKKVHDIQPVYSVRINLDYRAPHCAWSEHILIVRALRA